MRGSVRRRSRRSDQELRVRQLLLGAGEPVAVPGRMRRTSARGWGPWTDAVLQLGARGSGHVAWEASDPLAVDVLPSRSRLRPITGVTGVRRRPVRFREEAFFSKEGEIIVVTTDRHTMELSFRPEDSAEVLERVSALMAEVPGGRS